MRDKTIECSQCHNEFDFTVSEQIYYSKMGFDEPKRCSDCRKHKIKTDPDKNPKINNKNKKKHFRQKYENDF